MNSSDDDRIDEIHALSGAYAVDALDDLERAQFERHLDACGACREEVAGLRAAAAELGASVATPPPPSLRESVLAGIAEIRPLPPSAGTTPTVAPSEPTDHADLPTAGRGPARRRRGWRTALVAAAAVVAVAGVGSVVVDELRPDAPQQTMSAADQVIAAPDARTYSASLPNGHSARVVHSATQGRAVLLTSGMPAAPQGKVYEVWLQTPEGTMEPAGLMPGGDQKMLLDGDASEATAAGITVEPEGGSPEPTSAPVALFEFEQAT